MTKKTAANAAQDNKVLVDAKTGEEYELTIMPGAFDGFEGSQEELDELMEELQKSIADGSLLENARPVSLVELMDEDPAQAIEIAYQIGILDGLTDEFGDEVTAEQLAELIEELTGSRSTLGKRAKPLN